MGEEHGCQMVECKCMLCYKCKSECEVTNVRMEKMMSDGI